MLRRILLAVLIALCVPSVFAPGAHAECMDSPPMANEAIDAAYALDATVIEASNTIGPASPDSAEFDWHVELRVDRRYLGRIPDRLSYNGWAVGCHELLGDRLHTGDRLFIVSNVYRERPSPPGADPFAWIDAKVLAWKRVDGRWSFYENALDYGSDPEFYPRAAREATTTAEILRLVDLGFLPQTSTGPAAERSTEPMWVAVRGPEDWAPDPGFSLEVGGTAYAINANNGGGVTSIDAREPTIVRLRRLPDCEPVVRFAGRPGGRYVIRVPDTGTPRVEDWTGYGLDTGPALSPGPRVCDPLPDTATEVGSARDQPPWQLMVVSFLLGLVIIRPRLAVRPS